MCICLPAFCLLFYNIKYKPRNSAVIFVFPDNIGTWKYGYPLKWVAQNQRKILISYICISTGDFFLSSSSLVLHVLVCTFICVSVLNFDHFWQHAVPRDSHSLITYIECFVLCIALSSNQVKVVKIYWEHSVALDFVLNLLSYFTLKVDPL